MKRETAKRKIEFLDHYLSYNFQGYGERDHEAMMMGVKALEQVPCEDMVEIDLYSLIKQSYIEREVLDKIRAEIKGKIVKRPWLDFEDRERDRNDAFLEVLDIIDKYKAESEDKK